MSKTRGGRVVASQGRAVAAALPHSSLMMTSAADAVPAFSLEGREHIALHTLLKVEGWCLSGGAAKHTIDAGKVRVDGGVELRRRCKIVAGQLVEMHGHKVLVTA